MKSKWLLITILILSLVLSGCAGADNTVEDELEDAQQSVEETGEEANEELEELGEDIKEEIEETSDKTENEDKDDKVEDQKWPADFMPNVPEFEGKIFKVKEKDENNMYVAYEDVSQEEAVAYVEDLKQAGYTNEADEYIASTVVNFKGYDENGDFAKFRWSENGYATVDMIYPEETEEE